MFAPHCKELSFTLNWLHVEAAHVEVKITCGIDHMKAMFVWRFGRMGGWFCMYMCVCKCNYIYIYMHRFKDIQAFRHIIVDIGTNTHIYIYIYLYRYVDKKCRSRYTHQWLNQKMQHKCNFPFCSKIGFYWTHPKTWCLYGFKYRFYIHSQSF